MATTNLSIRYRPVRIGFLVRDGSLEDIIAAAGINTLLCGGVFNPIIPISGTNRLADYLIKLFNVDVLYEVNQSEYIRSFQEKYPYLRNPEFFDKEIFGDDYRTQKKKLAYLDILNLIEYYWERDLRHRSKKYKTDCTLVTWEEEDPLKNLFSVFFGYFPTTYKLRDNYRDAFLNGLHSKQVRIEPTTALDVNLIKCMPPLKFTLSELNTYGGRFQRNGIYIGDEDDFRDLYSFWNLRAAGLAIRFLPRKHIARCKDYIQAFLKLLNDQPSHPSGVDEMVWVHYQKRDTTTVNPDSEIVEIAKGFKTKRNFIYSAQSEELWNGLNIKAATIDYGVDSTLANVEKFYDKYSVVLNLQEKPPVVKNAGNEIQGQQVVLSIRPYVEGSNYRHHTLKPPFIQGLSDKYSEEIAVYPDRLRSEPEGIGVIIGTDDKHTMLYPMPHQTLIEQIFHHVGIEAKISQAGLLALRILEKLESHTAVGGAVFRIRGVRGLLEGLKADECIDRGEATNRIWAGGQFKRYQRQWKDAARAFDALLAKEFFRAGLELQCEHCKLKNWLSLKEIDDTWICTYCGNKHQMSLHLRNRGDWKFRKSGLFAKDNNQEGAIPVILTLLKLAETFDWNNLVYSPALNLTGDSIKCETDFCVLQYQKGQAIELGIGECKSYGGKIVQEDIDNLKRVYAKFKGTEIQCYLVFSKTADQFDPEEVDLYRGLVSEKIPIVLFLNKELERERFEDYSNTDVPNKYPHTFRDLSPNSYHRYLKQ